MLHSQGRQGWLGWEVGCTQFSRHRACQETNLIAASLPIKWECPHRLCLCKTDCTVDVKHLLFQQGISRVWSGARYEWLWSRNRFRSHPITCFNVEAVHWSFTINEQTEAMIKVLCKYTGRPPGRKVTERYGNVLGISDTIWWHS